MIMIDESVIEFISHRMCWKQKPHHCNCTMWRQMQLLSPQIQHHRMRFWGRTATRTPSCCSIHFGQFRIALQLQR